MRIMSKYQIILEECKLATAGHLGSATLTNVSRKQVFSVLSSVMECLTGVSAHSVFGPFILSYIYSIDL